MEVLSSFSFLGLTSVKKQNTSFVNKKKKRGKKIKNQEIVSGLELESTEVFAPKSNFSRMQKVSS